MHRLFAVCAIVIVGGSSIALAVHAKSSTVFLLSDAVEESVTNQGHGFELDMFALDVPAVPETEVFLFSPDLYGRVVDEFVTAESTQSLAHLERGPPLC